MPKHSLAQKAEAPNGSVLGPSDRRWLKEVAFHLLRLWRVKHHLYETAKVLTLLTLDADPVQISALLITLQ